MKKRLNIFFVSAEVFPFTQTGGLAEVSGALPKYLKDLGHDVRVMMPNYKLVNERKYVLRDVIRLQGLEIKVGDKVYNANTKSAFIPDSKVQIYFLDNKHFFNRDGLYFDSQTGREFRDNAERYIFFSKGCLETLKLLHWQPDIIHCNDWHTAMVPTLLKSVYRDDEFFKHTKTLLSVHNFAKQGAFEASALTEAGVPESLLNGNNAGSHFSFLGAGLEYADLLSTFSKSYAERVRNKSDESGGLQPILKKRKEDIYGIANGIDEVIWNPETDNLIPFNYSRRDLAGKYKNKEHLIDQFGLEYKEEIPVISVVTDLAEDQGGDLVVSALDSLMKMDVRLIISGRGDGKLQKELQSFRKKYPQQLGVNFELDSELAHCIAAGSDVYLMPSLCQSYSLNQLYNLAYGTIPVVADTDGLADFVEEFDPASTSGTGFIFTKFETEELLNAVKRAVTAYQDKTVWTKLVQNAMKKKFSWKYVVPKYVRLYQKLAQTKNSRR